MSEPLRCGDRVLDKRSKWTHVSVEYPDGSIQLLGDDEIIPVAEHGLMKSRAGFPRTKFLYNGTKYLIYPTMFRYILAEQPETVTVDAIAADGDIIPDWIPCVDLTPLGGWLPHDVIGALLSAHWKFDPVAISKIVRLESSITEARAQYAQRAYRRLRGEKLDDHVRALCNLSGEYQVIQGVKA